MSAPYGSTIKIARIGGKANGVSRPPAALTESQLRVFELSTESASLAASRALGSLTRACRESETIWRQVVIDERQELSAHPLGRTQLMYSSFVGDTARVNLLLRSGASPDRMTRGLDGNRTALWIAADAGHADVIAALLSFGANPTIKSRPPSQLTGSLRARMRDYTSPLERAVLRGYMPVVRALMPRCPPHLVAEAVFTSIFSRNTEAVKVLVSLHVDLNIYTEDGRTPLLIAAGMGQDGLIKILCDGGARTDLADAGGITPLTEAARSGHERTLRALIAAGAAIDARCAYAGRSALWWASCEGQVKTARRLCLLGADAALPATQGLAPVDVALAVNKPLVAAAIRAAVADRVRRVLLGSAYYLDDPSELE
jgi:ankyrin repeat protein